MGTGEGRASWIELPDGVTDGGDQTALESRSQRSTTSGQIRADWGLLLLAALMAVPFGLVAWLMA